MRGTVQDWLDEIEARFEQADLYFGHGTHNARDEAAWLVCNALEIPFASLKQRLTHPVGLGAAKLELIANERITSRKPLAYLLREAWLGEHRFYVDERVIVPRSFIAELLRDPRAPWRRRKLKIRRVLDLCTGSGCLAICAAHAWPEAVVDAVDLSTDALAVARRNVREHGLKDRVRVIQSDLFARLGAARYDLILTNPPYVDTPSMRTLPPEFRREPAIALVGGRDGLDLVRRIVARAAEFMETGAWLAMEIGHNRAAMTKAYPALPLRWLDTSAGDDFLCALRAPWPNHAPHGARSRRDD